MLKDLKLARASLASIYHVIIIFFAFIPDLYLYLFCIANRIGKKGCKALAEVIENNSSLTWLDIHSIHKLFI